MILDVPRIAPLLMPTLHLLELSKYFLHWLIEQDSQRAESTSVGHSEVNVLHIVLRRLID